MKFSATRDEITAITLIAQRAVRIARRMDVEYKMSDAMMDIEAAHSNGMRLKLNELALADDFNFTHDVFGIRRHLDRTTGELGDCFVPRFAL